MLMQLRAERSCSAAPSTGPARLVLVGIHSTVPYSCLQPAFARAKGLAGHPTLPQLRLLGRVRSWTASSASQVAAGAGLLHHEVDHLKATSTRGGARRSLMSQHSLAFVTLSTHPPVTPCTIANSH